MKEKLKRITIKEAQDIKDKDVLKHIEAEKPTLIIPEAKPIKEEIDPLLDLEITLRKCERLGLFEK